MQKFILKLTVVGALIFLLAACSKKSTDSNANQKAPRHQQAKKQKGERLQFSELLSQMDSNKDGKLSQTEVQGRLKKSFSKIDKDQDGFISETEYKDAPAPQRRGRN